MEMHDQENMEGFQENTFVEQKAMESLFETHQEKREADSRRLGQLFVYR